MVKLAIIAAAGWKGTSSVYPHIARGIPEPLLPLNGVMTILSRQVSQLRALGYTVFAGIGQPGSLYSHSASLRLREGIIDMDGAEEGARPPGPWTWPRVEYVHRIGAIPVLIEDPSGKSMHNTFDVCINSIGYTGWDQLLLMSGDYVFSDALLTRVLEWPSPFQMWMTCHSSGVLCHLMLSLDVKCAKAYMSLDPYDPNAGYGHRYHNDELRQVIGDAGASITCAQERFPGLFKNGWLDVDYPVEYDRALRMVESW